MRPSWDKPSLESTGGRRLGWRGAAGFSVLLLCCGALLVQHQHVRLSEPPNRSERELALEAQLALERRARAEMTQELGRLRRELAAAQQQ